MNEFTFIVKYLSFQSVPHLLLTSILHLTPTVYVTSQTHCVALSSFIHAKFLALCISSLLSKKGLMADASVDSGLGGRFVQAPATTKRLKISCLFLGCLALSSVSHSCCKGYCLQDLRRPSFPFQVGLLQPGETARST